MTAVLIRRGDKDKDTQGENHDEDRGKRRQTHTQAKRRGAKRNQPCWHLRQRLPPPRIVTK